MICEFSPKNPIGELDGILYISLNLWLSSLPNQSLRLTKSYQKWRKPLRRLIFDDNNTTFLCSCKFDKLWTKIDTTSRVGDLFLFHFEDSLYQCFIYYVGPKLDLKILKILECSKKWVEYS